VGRPSLPGGWRGGDGLDGEARVAARALLADLSVAVDVKNQARVHRWYARRFGFAIEP
jgi:hypothetical protein